MTVGTSRSEPSLAWLHCNECHRSFEHHNRLSEDGHEELRVIRGDLMFSFSSCGHFFCENCIQQHTIGGKFVCSICQGEASTFRIDNQVPRALEMYLKSPIHQLEDSISVMTFQITNANHLIKSLRSKVSQQKELISKAKQELASQKLLKEKMNELQQENERLCARLEDVTRAAGNGTPIRKQNIEESPVPKIHVPGRLSLCSPIQGGSSILSTRQTRQPLFQPVNSNNNNNNSNTWTIPRSPTASEIYLKNPGQMYHLLVRRGEFYYKFYRQTERSCWRPPQAPQFYENPSNHHHHNNHHQHHLTQPIIYNTPEAAARNYPSRASQGIIGQVRTRLPPPPTSPRPVNRPGTEYHLSQPYLLPPQNQDHHQNLHYSQSGII